MHPSAHLSPDPASLTESLSQQDRAGEPVNPEDSAASARQEMTTQQESVDHLAIEEARGENCNRIRALMADKRAGVGMPLLDEEREAAIKQAGRLIERHMADYERTGCLASRGNADRARLAMEALIRGRRPQYVAALEKARGLDLPACANEELTK